MSYVNRTGNEVISTEPAVAGRVVEYHDLVRWGPILAGLLVALATQLILSAIIGAVAAGTVEGSGAPRSIAPNAAGSAGLWSTIALLISLFTGGWVTARACGPMNRNTALLNGAILWATTLAASSWLLASGVSGAFGVAASNAAQVINQVGTPNLPRTNVTAQEARDIAANVRSGLWWFVFGSLLGLVAAMMGSVSGARSPRTNNYNP
ncbi:MAG: hypothetical protein RMY62_015255 [Nostoc sp. ZfuVER08]|jgi:hypothetical protein|uniref:Uncharacterized protein n=1 Tax=Nostoc punctiforme FACHB-252 TaxID=1357509 RepID=A0ABR8H3Z3_NOSPU|nr:hypothetical protein [Nostoc punctiforme]MBD2610002.1 hypothetical protein [Nostoc punctiforme FACHB-252]MBL1199981.1 hypothetical protein [Nostoc sp. GBBB01]MDZ8010587.1 hypothetical protein [Nostoc sp. ZfuVER08]